MDTRDVRGWDALGLWLQVQAVCLALVFALIGWELWARALGLDATVGLLAPYDDMDLAIALAPAAVGVLLLWKARGGLVRGWRPVRIGAIVWFAATVALSLGASLVGYVVAFLVVARPRRYRAGPASVERHPPALFRPNAVTGSLAVTGYLDRFTPHPRTLPARTPVQVLSERDGQADVVAADGWRALVDLRMLVRPGDPVEPVPPVAASSPG